MKGNTSPCFLAHFGDPRFDKGHKEAITQMFSLIFIFYFQIWSMSYLAHLDLKQKYKLFQGQVNSRESIQDDSLIIPLMELTKLSMQMTL